MNKILLRLRKSLFKKFGLRISPIENNSLEYLFPEATNSEIDIVKTAAKFSLTSFERIFCLLRSIQHVNNNNLEGDFVECGVWKGGNLILFKKMIEKLKIKNKKIYAFDTFEGMSEPTDNDSDADGFLGGFKAEYYMRTQKKDINIDNIHGYAPIEMVKKNLKNNTSDINDLF